MNILEAAKEGDVKFLKIAYDENVGDLDKYFPGREDHYFRNLLHEAIWNRRYVFLCEALDILKSQPTLIIRLICQTEKRGYNPLHYAVDVKNIFVVKLLVNAYVTAVASANCKETLKPPWLHKNKFKDTPVHHCFLGDNKSTGEVIARYLVSQDQRLGQGRYPPRDECSTMILDEVGTSVVYLATTKGWSLLLEKILTSDLPYRVDGFKWMTPLHFASRCNAKVARLLLEKHPDLIKVSQDGYSVLESAVEDGAAWLVKLMLIVDESPAPTWIKACRRFMWHKSEDSGETPLHICARNGNTEIAQLIIQAYDSAVQDEATEWDAAVNVGPYWIHHRGVNLLYTRNSHMEIPVIVALRNKNDDCGEMLIIETFPLLLEHILKGLHWDVMIAAVNNDCLKSIKVISELLSDCVSDEIEQQFHSLPRAVGNIFIYLVEKYPDKYELNKSEEWEKVLVQLPEFLKEPVKDAKTLLKEAAEKGDNLLVTLFLKSDKALLKEPAPAWQAACESGYMSTLHIFICMFGDDRFIKHCHNVKQTPLHHIKLKHYEQYMDLLKIPVLEKMKNQTDSDGATPLHLAINRNDLELTKALLKTDGINISIKENNGTTAFILLENHCKDSDTWREQYIELLKMPELTNQIDSDGATPLHRAIQREDLELTKALLEIKGIEVSIKDKNGMMVFDLLENHIKLSKSWHDLYMEVLKMPVLEVLKNQIDIGGATPLHRAIQREDLEVTKVLLETTGIDSFEDVNGTTTFDLLEKHIKRSNSWREQYLKVLKMPVIEKLKNRIGIDGATPLHRAIEREDLEVTKALLEIKGIKVNIKNKNGRTAFSLLENSCKFSDSWGKMCREIQQGEIVQEFKYLSKDLQNNLSLVAALVATITFAAGITVPGGEDNTGTAVLSTKAAFLVFSVSNTTAMCNSMMVLFLLLGPMMWDLRSSSFYVRLSLYLLLLSLGGTMLAFMTGVYATMIPKVNWNAIFILVSCSLTLFLACVFLFLTNSPQFLDKDCKSFEWLKKVCSNINPLNPSQRSGSSNDHVDTNIATTPTIQSQPGSTDGLMTQASGIQLTSSVPSNDTESGSTNTLMTQPSASLVLVSPELCQGQKQNKIEMLPKAPDDLKIKIESS